MGFLILLGMVGYGFAAFACGITLCCKAEDATKKYTNLPGVLFWFMLPMALLWPLTLLVAMYAKALRWQAEQRKEPPAVVTTTQCHDCEDRITARTLKWRTADGFTVTPDFLGRKVWTADLPHTDGQPVSIKVEQITFSDCFSPDIMGTNEAVEEVTVAAIMCYGCRDNAVAVLAG